MKKIPKSQTPFRWFSLLAIFLTVFTLHAQERTVTGVVTDAIGETLIGASVVIKGTTNGTVTDLEGAFSLSQVPENAVIVVSFMGYITQEIPYTGQGHLQVVLKDNTELLDEVVVIGYGSLDRKELSSSIVQVNRADFQQGAVGNPMELITGRVAGLNAVNTSPANPNSGSSLQIRGATSLSASNSPLIVIDGIVGADIRNLSSQDIESMTVLKDGASAAIYGTRGANGVILITTRKGSGAAGTHKVMYDGWFGMNIETFKPRVLTADEFRQYERGYNYGFSTDWSKEIRRDLSYDTNHYISVDSSTQNGSYGASFNYKKATGLDIASAREEYGARFTQAQRFMSGFMEINSSLFARKVKEEWGEDGQFGNAYYINPTMPVYNEDGTFYHPASPTGARNPVEQLTDVTRGGNRVYLLGSVEAKLNLLNTKHHTLNTALTYAHQYNDLSQHEYSPSTTAESEQNNYAGRAKVQDEKWWYSQVEWITNYTFHTDGHILRFMGGYSYKEDHYERRQMENRDFPFDSTLWHDISTGSYLNDGNATMGTNKTLSKLIGVFGRVNYNWNDLLMASASLRYEGSTKFGPDAKWGYFPAASLAWEMANMPFLTAQRSWLQSLKPRISYGVTGRSDFNPYQSQSTYSAGVTSSANHSYLIDGSWVQGYKPSRNANRDLAWEKGITTNIGVDFEVFGRVRGSLEYYDRRSKDLLYTYTAPQPPMIYRDILVNVGTTVNTGFEMTLNADVIAHKDFGWNTGIIYSTGQTKLKKLSNDLYEKSYIDLYGTGTGNSVYLFRVDEGGKVGNFYGYEHAGIDEEGYLLIYNKDGEAIRKGSEQNEDKRIIGNGAPKHFLSWSNSLYYKNFDLSIFFRGAFGFDIMNRQRYSMGTIASGNANVLLSAYTKYGEVTKDAGMVSSWYLENGNFFKLENISLGYTLPMKNKLENKFIERIRVYAAAKNVFVLSGYSGNDPSLVSVNGLTPGVDSGGNYPSSAQISFGLTINFK
ncbi:MAG: SusC/RagA family TonB-linked outer membrane protein [Bacteroides sp.]|nr:SusC/RagA family TonB-linked outer membrane protein [Bacteroides sp.]